MKKASDQGEVLALASRIREMVETFPTQSEAAAHAQTSPRQITAYLSGNTCPGFLFVSRLTSASGFHPNYVMKGKGPKRMGEEEFARAESNRLNAAKARFLGLLIEHPDLVEAWNEWQRAERAEGES